LKHNLVSVIEHEATIMIIWHHSVTSNI